MYIDNKARTAYIKERVGKLEGAGRAAGQAPRQDGARPPRNEYQMRGAQSTAKHRRFARN